MEADDREHLEELRDRCDGVSPMVLDERFHELRKAGILEWAASDDVDA